jgi:hypothetical protein
MWNPGVLRPTTREEKVIADIAAFMRARMRSARGDDAMRFEVARRALGQALILASAEGVEALEEDGEAMVEKAEEAIRQLRSGL